jgi:hypothetical protein
MSTFGGNLIPDEVEKLKRNGTHIIAVGITDFINMTELAVIASKPEYVFKLENYFNLKFILDPLMALACVEPGK